ncbi:MAG: succinylglutamate desuccinylase/aspartoacylase family protein [Planctomycetota bacterium]
MSDTSPPKTEADPAVWGDVAVAPGEHAAVEVAVGASYSGADIRLPVFVWRGKQAGPIVSVTAAVHGDEINGTGAIRYLITHRPFTLTSGTLVLVPVVNLPGFEQHARYLPDRRDLNRCFPGNAEGSLAARMADAFFNQVIRRCDYGIDLHTAAVRRTNFPNVRADMNHPELAALARAFGAELIVSSRGPDGSLRRSATKAGVPTLILEAGEVWKVQPNVVEYAVRGITNCLRHLGMIPPENGDTTSGGPAYRVETDSTKWVRAKHGGFLRFHVSPGQIVAAGEPLATNARLTGEEQNVLLAPRDGIVLGMTTLPSVSPGDPVCHLAFPRRGVLKKVERAVDRLASDDLHERIRDEFDHGLVVQPPGS